MRFFRSAAAFRGWLERHHADRSEAWLGFYRKGLGPANLDYTDAVDLALCFGWIDGIRKKLGETTYTNRFTPRKPGSIWSLVNVARVERLKAQGLMHPAGLAAFARRDPARSGVYSFEERPTRFPAPLERQFKADAEAWTTFTNQPPGYRRLAISWVTSARREDTRARRLAELMDVSRRGLRLGVLVGQKDAVPPPARRRPR